MTARPDKTQGGAPDAAPNTMRDATPDTVLEAAHLVKTYRAHGKTAVRAVDGVGFTLRRGEVLGVIGESGCGKSTLGRMLVRLEEPDEGVIRYNGKTYREAYRRDPLAFRRLVQIVFQNPFDTFDPRYSIEHVLTGVLKLHRIGRNHDERLALVAERLEQAGLAPADQYLARYPHELSGGQLQRISILRAMLLNPQFLVADEPTSMLDASIQADILNMLVEQCRERNTAMVFISHDIAAVRYVADKVAVMYLGRFVEYGDTDEVLHRPRHPYTRALIDGSLRLERRADAGPIRLDGEPQAAGAGDGCAFYPRCFRRRDDCRLRRPEPADLGGGRQVSCFYPLEEAEAAASP
jgi:oligopeptide/dipeptide ABC transporter ATP-binding protein